MDVATYDKIAVGLIPKLKVQPGFILHVAFETPDGLGVSEIWETREQHEAWSTNVEPHMPPGAERNYLEIHSLVSPE
jgi:heme-degrading monooxygenase HmoA